MFLLNNTNKEIAVKEDLVIIADDHQVFPLEPRVLNKYLRQKSASYLFYLLLTPLNIATYDSDGNYQRIYPIGLILGPALAVGNLIGASMANKNLNREYSNEYIINKKIGPYETITGLMAIKATGCPSLSIFRLGNN